MTFERASGLRDRDGGAGVLWGLALCVLYIYIYICTRCRVTHTIHFRTKGQSLTCAGCMIRNMFILPTSSCLRKCQEGMREWCCFMNLHVQVCSRSSHESSKRLWLGEIHDNTECQYPLEQCTPTEMLKNKPRIVSGSSDDRHDLGTCCATSFD